MPDWLLSGAGRRLPHQPDQLPVLQHALQATWHAAMRRWSKDDFADPRLEIRLEDLPGQGDSVPSVPDLSKCLQVRADKAAERARERFAKKAQATTADGETVLQAAFRALAHRDDRGNWARRFADIADIMTFLTADPNSSLAKVRSVRFQVSLTTLPVFGIRARHSVTSTVAPTAPGWIPRPCVERSNGSMFTVSRLTPILILCARNNAHQRSSMRVALVCSRGSIRAAPGTGAAASGIAVSYHSGDTVSGSPACQNRVSARAVVSNGGT
jgi:hypothetical protein